MWGSVADPKYFCFYSDSDPANSFGFFQIRIQICNTDERGKLAMRYYVVRIRIHQKVSDSFGFWSAALMRWGSLFCDTTLFGFGPSKKFRILSDSDPQHWCEGAACFAILKYLVQIQIQQKISDSFGTGIRIRICNTYEGGKLASQYYGVRMPAQVIALLCLHTSAFPIVYSSIWYSNIHEG
jgi:hypothetical protein